MKKIFFFVMIMAVQHVCAQTNAIDRYYKDFQQKNSLDAVSASGKMLLLLIDDKKGREKEELAAMINKLTGLKMLSKSNPQNGNELFNSANTLLPKTYKAILSMDESDRKVKCYTLDATNEKISELIMIAWQWGRFMVLSITGDINLGEIYKLLQSINFSNLNQQQFRKE